MIPFIRHDMFKFKIFDDIAGWEGLKSFLKIFYST